MLKRVVNMFSFVRNCQAVFQSSCTSLNPHQQPVRVAAARQLPRHLVLSVFRLGLEPVESLYSGCFNLQFSNDMDVRLSIVSHVYLPSVCSLS